MYGFDEKIFKFLTDAENWTVAREIYDRMEYVKKRLVDDFWDNVKNEIDIRKDVKGWRVVKNGNEFGITYPEWNNKFRVEFGGLTSEAWLGVWCDDNNKEISRLNQDISRQLKSIDKRLTRQEAGHPAWFYLDDDFNQTITLNKIIPSRKNDLIQNYISTFVDIVDKVKPVIDNLNSKLK